MKWHNRGTTSNTADFYKTFYPFDGIFDNSYLTASKSWLSPPTEATCVNQSIMPASLLKIQQKNQHHWDCRIETAEEQETAFPTQGKTEGEREKKKKILLHSLYECYTIHL